MDKLVVWKDEGSTGPCTVYHDRSEFGKMREYGEPLPESVEEKGWKTLQEAQKIAKSIGAEFMTL